METYFVKGEFNHRPLFNINLSDIVFRDDRGWPIDREPTPCEGEESDLPGEPDAPDYSELGGNETKDDYSSPEKDPPVGGDRQSGGG